jgi:hypothetical protein
MKDPQERLNEIADYWLDLNRSIVFILFGEDIGDEKNEARVTITEHDQRGTSKYLFDSKEISTMTIEQQEVGLTDVTFATKICIADFALNNDDVRFYLQESRSEYDN